LVMTARRRAQDRARRKEEILQAAREVFAEEGYQATTVEAVAERAEIGKGTISLYCESKDALRGELLLQALDELTAQLKAAGQTRGLAPDARLRAMAEAYVAFAQQSPDYFHLLNAYDNGGLSTMFRLSSAACC
jgi:AcrR family transcriptional regulator